MPSNNAEINWTSKDAAVIRSFEKVERNLDDVARKLNKVEQESKKATKMTEDGFLGAASGVKKTITAIIGAGGLITGMNMLSDANRRAIEEAQEIGKAYDELGRKFRVQAGLSEVDTKKYQLEISRAAERNAVPMEVASRTATQLVSSGASVEVATGSGLDAVLKTRAATNATGKNTGSPEDFAKSMVSYLISQNMAITGENILKTGTGAQRLFASTAFQAADFGELAKHGSTFVGALTPAEQMSAFSVLADVGPSAEGGTNLRNMVSRMKTFSADPGKVAALKQLGIDPEQVDLTGESFGDVLTTFKKTLGSVDQEQRAPILKKLFEEAGVASFQTMLDRQDVYGQRIGLQSDTKAFNEAVRVAQSGRAATAARQRARIERKRLEKDYGDDLIEGEIEARGLEAGRADFSIDMAKWAYRGQRYFLNVEPDEALETFRVAGVATNPVHSTMQGLAYSSGGETGVPNLDKLIDATVGVRQEIQGMRQDVNAQKPRVRQPPAAGLNAGGLR